MRADNSRHIVAAARRRAEDTRRRAVSAMRRMDAAGQRITYQTVAREAGVSRSWLYAQDDLRVQISQLRQRHPAASASPVPPQRQQASASSLLRRLEAATERIRRLEAGNRHLRGALALAPGERRAAEVIGHDTPKRTTPKIGGPY
jgi:hypothetical protein